jgi:dimethylglycine dehydrogenase
MRWFNDHLDAGVSVRDLDDEMGGMSLAGPNSREVLKAVLTDGDADALKFMGCAQMDVGLVRCHVGRLSVAGELGYELHCRAGDLKALRDTLLAAGEAHGLVEYGFNALLSLRLEKSFGIWSAEFTQGYTPGMTGMDRWIDWSKDFIGKKAALAEHDGNGPAKLLVTLEVDADGADAAGFEPVWKGDQKIGFVTSGGYGHTLGTSLAMALVNREFADVGSDLSVHVVGVERSAKVISASPYDPDGSAMRG